MRRTDHPGGPASIKLSRHPSLFKEGKIKNRHSMDVQSSANSDMKLLPYSQFAVVLLLAFQPAGARTVQTPPQKIDLSKVGPQVGDRVPDFSLKDQSGKTWTLQSIMGPKGAMLVFMRSADW